jgi:hypothetical protein
MFGTQNFLTYYVKRLSYTQIQFYTKLNLSQHSSKLSQNLKNLSKNWRKSNHIIDDLRT